MCEQLRALAHERPRFGYRRLRILLQQDDIVINHKKTQRLYREEGLTVRRRKGRRRPSSLRYESVHDQLASGRQFRLLNLVDDVTRECLAAVLDTPICGKRVVRELTDLIAVRGKPGMIVSDNELS